MIIREGYRPHEENAYNHGKGRTISKELEEGRSIASETHTRHRRKQECGETEPRDYYPSC